MTVTPLGTKPVRSENVLTLIAPEVALAVAEHVLGMATGKATVSIWHRITARTVFVRNDIKTIESETVLEVGLALNIDGKPAIATTTQTDAEGLRDLVETATESAQGNQRSGTDTNETLAPPATFTDPPIYFEESVKAGGSDVQAQLARDAAARAETVGLIAAGTVEVTSEFNLVANSIGFRGHTRNTYGEFSMTARTRDGRGSGWARAGGEDFSRVEPKAVTERAIDLCQRSDEPVAVEPGRYTVILEPEAVAQFVDAVIGLPTSGLSEFDADQGATVFSKKEGGNKRGLRMAEERVQLLYDPVDPELPFSPLGSDGSLFSRTYWLENGVLKNLRVDSWYGRMVNHAPVNNPSKARLELTGQAQTLEAMIASTKRGIWVHRFSSADVIVSRTLLLTGVTRDGTFLIENGKITKPIKNLRYNESPFFIWNKIDAFGPSVRADKRYAVPRLKVHDFEFTSLSDAV